jgi:hypothetical protein
MFKLLKYLSELVSTAPRRSNTSQTLGKQKEQTDGASCAQKEACNQANDAFAATESFK